jgi:TPR repeat protein
MIGQIVADAAIRTCNAEGGTRSAYLRGRVHMAGGDFADARQDFERARAAGVRSASVELGRLLTLPAAHLQDVPRAISLWEKAWTDGVTVAAYELGSLYEHGVRGAPDGRAFLLSPDAALAREWYEKAAAAGDPQALARLAEQEDAAAGDAVSASLKGSLMLRAFKHYAAAAERARREAWPDDVWRSWRYRRASLARQLARAGRMKEAAEAYEAVTSQYAAEPSWWRRTVEFVSGSIALPGRNRHLGSQQIAGDQG